METNSHSVALLRRLYLAGAIFCSFASLSFAQGPLTPPAGTPAPGMKTLAQIEPRTPISSLPITINQPGSYYLTSNLSYSLGAGDAIRISTSNVTLDLGGFTLKGESTSGTPTAIRVLGTSTAAVKNVLVQNGAIEGFYYAVTTSYAEHCTIRDIRAADQRGPGLYLANSTGLRVSRVDVFSSGFTAFSLAAVVASVLEDCTSTKAANTGFGSSTELRGVVFERCTAVDSTGSGFAIGNGTAAVVGNVIRSCTALRNQSRGIYLLGSGCTGNRIEGNTLASNAAEGLFTSGTSKNIIVRNVITDDTITTSASDVVGPLVTTTGTISSTNPWANFVFP